MYAQPIKSVLEKCKQNKGCKEYIVTKIMQASHPMNSWPSCCSNADICIAKEGADEGRHAGMKHHRSGSHYTVFLTMTFVWIYDVLRTSVFHNNVRLLTSILIISLNNLIGFLLHVSFFIVKILVAVLCFKIVCLLLNCYRCDFLSSWFIWKDHRRACGIH